MDTIKKRGRPPLAIKSNRIRITVDVAPKTHAALIRLRAKDGLSIGRQIDALLPLHKKS